MFKRRSVPARAKNLHSNVRFSLHVLRVFLNASLKNSGNVLFKIKVCPCMCCVNECYFRQNNRFVDSFDKLLWQTGQTHYKKYFHKSWREEVRHRAKRLFLGLPRERHYNSFYTPKNV